MARAQLIPSSNVHAHLAKLNLLQYHVFIGVNPLVKQIGLVSCSIRAYVFGLYMLGKVTSLYGFHTLWQLGGKMRERNQYAGIKTVAHSDQSTRC